MAQSKSHSQSGIKLVVVESPTKAKTIRKFLGKEYIVESCMGHIRDLPQSSKDIPEKFKKEKGLYVLENESVIIDKMANEIVNDYQYKTNASNIGELLPTFDELNDVTIRILSTVNDDFDFDSLNLLPEQKFVIPVVNVHRN